MEIKMILGKVKKKIYFNRKIKKKKLLKKKKKVEECI
jgi:hypothetical protein